MEKDIVFVTEDKWVREHGWLDPTDRQIAAEASSHGLFKIRILNVSGMMEAMKKVDPLKFIEFHHELEGEFGKRLTYDDLVKLGATGYERQKEFSDVVKNMNLGQASQIRVWRCDTHMTWRAIARAAWREKWFGRQWGPSSNQIMGMALSDKAAQLYGENYREPPWN